jgi:hypothetical protein
MKKIVYTLFLIISFSIALISGAFLDSFTAKSDSGNILIEWKTKDENNVKQFEIERSPAVNESFIAISVVPAKGSNSVYQFIDKSAYKTDDAIYKYRLKIVDFNSSTTYSGMITIAHKVSSVKSTWGSIKSMFR